MTSTVDWETLVACDETGVFKGIVCDGAHGLGCACVGFTANQIAAHSSVDAFGADNGLEATYCSDSECDIVQFDFATMRNDAAFFWSLFCADAVTVAVETQQLDRWIHLNQSIIERLRNEQPSIYTELQAWIADRQNELTRAGAG